MRALEYPESEIRASRISRVLRFVLVKDRRMKSKYAEYYTGIHDTPESMWSTDPKMAVLYAHMVLGTEDLVSLREGKLPEGRRGVRTADRLY